jgi:fermentation-respiration switch protein FrsA (DUF1100 family)
MPITPESQHEPVVVRDSSNGSGGKAKKDNHITTLVKKEFRLTWRKVLRFVIELFLVITLPFVIATAVGIVQVAFPQVPASAVTPSDLGLAYKAVFVPTQDGLKLSAWDVAAEDGSTDSAIIVLPGYGVDKGSIVSRTAFLAAKHRLLYIDYRNIDGSEGSYSSLGLKEIADARAALDYLHGQNVQNIGVYGFTMGGALALRLAGNESVKAVVTEDAYASYTLAAQEPYRFVGPARPLFAWWARWAVIALLRIDMEAVSPVHEAAMLHQPALIIHSQVNEAVPVKHFELLREALGASENVEFWLHDGSTDLPARQAFAEKLTAFYDAHLR